MAKIVFMILVFAVALTSCGGRGDEPRRGIDVVAPGRPGAGGNGVYDVELADAVWRYVGCGVELRYDSGGVLFSVAESGIVDIIAIDGLDRVKVQIGAIGSDSVATKSVMSVNGTEMKLRELKMLKRTSSAVWYRGAMSDGGSTWIVIPDD